MTKQAERGQTFRQLHQRPGAFLIPNPWDAGSARMLQGLGYEALATTSSGFALTLGRADGMVTRDEKFDHCSELTDACDIPVSADLEHGFADDPEGVGATIREFAASGIVGGSIEDYSRNALYDFDQAVERVQAAAEAAHALGFPFTLTARAEILLRGEHDLDEAIRRLQAFEKVGADVLYAPGLRSLKEVETVSAAVQRPVNALASLLPDATLAELADAGAKRISVGGSLAFEAYAALAASGQRAQDTGTFRTKPAAPASRVQALLGGAGSAD